MSYRKRGRQQYRQNALRLNKRGVNLGLVKLGQHRFIKDPWTKEDLRIGRKGFNSHGEWSTLGRIRETEKESGNYFPSSLRKFPDETPAIWVTLTRRKALRYAVLADEWERVDDPSKPLTAEEKEMMRGMAEVQLLPTDVVAFTDGDAGYLIVRPGG